ncbi:hypothetical protein [Cohnella sp. AR92]|uniref:hypothetical protein n=1 Tax=Cohnella sp. AR92 TaxID=648716 RepID=UPI000F8CD655|nr:hypothetical protein ELR57_16675 [Cohnella sp. AR92]
MSLKANKPVPADQVILRSRDQADLAVTEAVQVPNNLVSALAVIVIDKVLNAIVPSAVRHQVRDPLADQLVDQPIVDEGIEHDRGVHLIFSQHPIGRTGCLSSARMGRQQEAMPGRFELFLQMA